MCRLSCHVALTVEVQKANHAKLFPSIPPPPPTHGDRERVVFHTGSNTLKHATSFLSCRCLPASPHLPADAGLLTCFTPSTLFTFDKKKNKLFPRGLSDTSVLTQRCGCDGCRCSFLSAKPHVVFSPFYFLAFLHLLPLPPLSLSCSYSLSLCEPAVCR